MSVDPNHLYPGAEVYDIIGDPTQAFDIPPATTIASLPYKLVPLQQFSSNFVTNLDGITRINESGIYSITILLAMNSFSAPSLHFAAKLILNNDDGIVDAIISELAESQSGSNTDYVRSLSYIGYLSNTCRLNVAITNFNTELLQDIGLNRALSTMSVSRIQ